MIGAVGVIVIAVGLYRVSKGVKMDVDDELDMSGMSPDARTVDRAARGGRRGRVAASDSRWSASSSLRSAMTYDPNEATGLDGALRRLARQLVGCLRRRGRGHRIRRIWHLLSGNLHSSTTSSSVMYRGTCL